MKKSKPRPMPMKKKFPNEKYPKHKMPKKRAPNKKRKRI